MDTKKHYNVAAAVIADNGEILCTRKGQTRYSYTTMKWEFPGGKIEQGETPEEAIKRELIEEMDYKVEPLRHLMTLEHEYPDFAITLRCYLCKADSRQFTLKEHSEYRWAKPEELKQLDWCEADNELIEMLSNGSILNETENNNIMKYNFDEIIERKGTNCVKHDELKELYGREDLLPMWVADMDFRSPDFVMEAIRNRCQHEVLGYHLPSQSYWDTMLLWLKNHYRIAAAQEELHYIPGIVAGISFVLQAFTKESDKVLILNPVYPPFIDLPRGSLRELVCSKLSIENGRFKIDFDDLEQKAQGCKVMILSNPHNPGGTVWSREDLEKIANICHKYHVIVIADEIHADLTLPGYRHTSFSTVSDKAKECSITFIAPSKTFNIAGLGSSISYTPNKDLREPFHNYLVNYHVAEGNIFAYVGAEAAFKYGEDWLKQVLEYLKGNVEVLKQWLSHTKIKAVVPEASYLAWLDFSDYGYSHEELKDRLVNRARVALNDGTTFGGDDYRCRFRLNLGCPKATVEEALKRIEDCLK